MPSPAPKRISLPSSMRLTTITEGANPTPLEPPPPIPRRSSRRNSASHSESNSWRHSRRWSGGSRSARSARSDRTAPPPYEWVPEPITTRSEEEGMVVDERLEKLRRERSGTSGVPGAKRRRGGWMRAGIVLGVVILVGVVLGVGLGVGLKKKNGGGGKEEDAGGGNEAPDEVVQKFPLGEYSMDTALRSVATDCTSNPATWRCFPYVIYNSDGSTNDTSVASFNWIISNTSSTYATDTTETTPDSGVPANLTVSTSNDPFGIMFTGQALTYIANPSNTSSARYTFSFISSRKVIPSPAITADNTNVECFFNQTIFTASIYLSAASTFPTGEASIGGYAPWPYAVEITQTAAGGSDVPNCYSIVDGREGEPVEAGLVPQPDGAECMCDYRNF